MRLYSLIRSIEVVENDPCGLRPQQNILQYRLFAFMIGFDVRLYDAKPGVDGLTGLRIPLNKL